MQHVDDYLRKFVRDVDDFPIKGVLFRDITPIMQDVNAAAVARRAHYVAVADLATHVDKVVGIESRGFFFGPLLASDCAAGFVPARKPGKLPRTYVEEFHTLEYGQSSLQVHKDAVLNGDRVVIVDDLLATGGTCLAACKLVERLGGKIEACVFLIELMHLKGREKLAKYKCKSVITY